MKKIGLIGGMGPESTLEYYNAIVSAFKNDQGILNYPEIIIYSVNLSEFIDLMNIKAYDRVVDLLAGKLESLQKAGADLQPLQQIHPICCLTVSMNGRHYRSSALWRLHASVLEIKG